jgi:hypothetical protein
MNGRGLIFILIGLFTLCAVGFEWNWFMNNRKTQALAAVLGRNGARLFYGLLATFVIVLGILISLGILKGFR